MTQTLLRSARDLARLSLLTAIIGAVAAAMLARVHESYRVAAAGYEIAALTKAHRALQEENRRLLVAAAEGGSPGRVASRAALRYGLAPTRPDQIIVARPPGAEAAELAQLGARR